MDDDSRPSPGQQDSNEAPTFNQPLEGELTWSHGDDDTSGGEPEEALDVSLPNADPGVAGTIIHPEQPSAEEPTSEVAASPSSGEPYPERPQSTPPPASSPAEGQPYQFNQSFDQLMPPPDVNPETGYREMPQLPVVDDRAQEKRQENSEYIRQLHVLDTPATPPQATPAAITKKRSPRILLLMILVAVMAIGAIVAVIYGELVVPNQPDFILGKGLANTMQASSSELDISIQTTGGPSDRDFTMTSTGMGSKAGIVHQNLSFKTSAGAFTAQVLSSGQKDLYANVNNLGTYDSFALAFKTAQGTNDLNASTAAYQGLSNQWLELSPLLNVFNSRLFAIGQSSTKLNTADYQILGRLYTKYRFLHVTQSLPSETVGGVASYHYKVAINQTKLVAFLSQSEILVKDLGITDADITAVTNANVSHISSLDVWVGKSNKFVDKVGATFKADGLNVAASVALGNFNQNVASEQPTQFLPFAQVYGTLKLSAQGDDKPADVQQFITGYQGIDTTTLRTFFDLKPTTTDTSN